MSGFAVLVRKSQVIQPRPVVPPRRRSLPAIEGLDRLRCLSELADPASSVEAGVGPLMVGDAQPGESLTPMAQLSRDTSRDRYRDHDHPKSEPHLGQSHGWTL